MAKKDKVIAIAGPTASGKSALAVWAAQKLGGEIISADSRQIYKEFDIASAKPSESEKCGVAHYMIDVVSPDEEFSVADFTRMSNDIIKKSLQKGKFPSSRAVRGFISGHFCRILIFRRFRRIKNCATN